MILPDQFLGGFPWNCHGVILRDGSDGSDGSVNGRTTPLLS